MPVYFPFKRDLLRKTQHSTTRGRVDHIKWGKYLSGSETNSVWTVSSWSSLCSLLPPCSYVWQQLLFVSFHFYFYFLSFTKNYYYVLNDLLSVSLPACLPCYMLCKKELYSQMLMSHHVYLFVFSLVWFSFILYSLSGCILYTHMYININVYIVCFKVRRETWSSDVTIKPLECSNWFCPWCPPAEDCRSLLVNLHLFTFTLQSFSVQQN